MLWAAIAAAIVGAVLGSAGGPALLELIEKDWKKGLRRHVKDRAKREAADAVAARLEADAQRLYDLLARELDQFQHVHRRHDASLDEYLDIVGGIGEFSEAATQTLLDYTFEIREAIGDGPYEAVMADIQEDAAKRDVKEARATARRRNKEARKAGN